MQCKKCGKELSDDAKFCSVCGSSQDEEKEKKWRIKMSIFLIILALIGVGIALYEVLYEPADSVKLCDRWYVYEWRTYEDEMVLEKTSNFVEFTKDGEYLSNSAQGKYTLISEGKLKIEIDGNTYDVSYKFDGADLVLEYNGNKTTLSNYK